MYTHTFFGLDETDCSYYIQACDNTFINWTKITLKLHSLKLQFVLGVITKIDIYFCEIVNGECKVYYLIICKMAGLLTKIITNVPINIDTKIKCT